MSALALVGSVTLILNESTLRKILLPLVAFSAGSLIGGAFFHMIPAAADHYGAGPQLYLWVMLGFTLFFALEQFLHWHHCHRSSADRREPLTHLILLGDGLHNFLGGLAVAGTFLLDIRLGIMAWLAAAAHEVPQELGDFGVLVHGGWEKGRALLFNVISGLAFLLGALIAYAVSVEIDVTFLVPIAAGNFLYIGASDLVPEVNRSHSGPINLVHFASFGLGAGLLYVLKVALGGG